MTPVLDLDDATMRALERHETQAHSIPAREVRDLGDSFVLYDPRDADAFWNRMVSVRWPEAPAAFDRRLAEAISLFAILDRIPHVWPSPVHGTPPDLVARLEANGFRDLGGGHLMVHRSPASIGTPSPEELGEGVTLTTIRTAGDAQGDDVEAIADVLAEAFGALPSRVGELAGDLSRTLDDPRITLVLVRVDGESAAVAKASTFDGLTYLSSIATRARFRGRRLAGLATRQAVAASGGAHSRFAYLGVFSENASALRLYERLGFTTVGESPDLLLG